MRLTLYAFLALFFLANQSTWAEEEIGPHKGILAEWGDEEFHLEIVVDRKTGDVTVFVYGTPDDLKNAKTKPIDSKWLTLSLKTTEPATTFRLLPKPSKEDPDGRASVFLAQHDALKTDKKLRGTLSGKVGPKPYTSEFKQP